MGTLLGSSAADTLHTTATDLAAMGLGGNDSLYGSSTNDSLYGGAGDDLIAGGYVGGALRVNPDDPLVAVEHIGVDQVFGGDGNDRVTLVGAYSSTLDGGAGTDTLYTSLLNPGEVLDLSRGALVYTAPSGGAAPELRYHLSSFENVLVDGGAVIGDDGPNRLTGPGDPGDYVSFFPAGAVSLYGGGGDDTLEGSVFKDILDGGDGNDLLSPLTNGDTVFGGAGEDTLSFAALSGGAGVTVSLADGTAASLFVATSFQGVEDVIGTGAADLIAGDSGANRLDGGAGDDTLLGGGGEDTLVGGIGLDRAVFSGVQADYTVTTGRTGFEVAGPEGTVTLSGIEQVRFADAVIWLDPVRGSNGPDHLSGRPEGETILAGGGDDTVTASGGRDTLDGGAGSDTLAFSGFAHDYALAVTAGAGAASGGPEGGTDTLTSVETLTFLDGTLTFDPQSTAAQIVRLYDSFLGRAPDAAGFESYLRFVAAGHSFQDMADNAAASPEFHDATAALSDTDYIRYVYARSLHREPDPGGLQNYLDALHSGALTRTSLIVQAAESPEHVALTAGLVAQGLWIPDEKVESLELLYDAAVQRQPDAYGLAGYSAELGSGASYRQIANQMASSAEFQAAHAGQDDAAFVDSLYVAELGRHGEPAGLAAYTDQLAHGYTRGDVLYETAFSPEHQAHVLAFSDPLLG